MIKHKKSIMGLTLIEALIWFAIFAAVVAGVFALYSQSRNSSNASTVNKELSTIFSQTEQLFASEDTAQLTSNTLALNLGIFPSSLKTAKGSTNVQNVFGGNVTISGQTPSGFTVTYTNIPRGEVCANIVKAQKAVGWDSVIAGKVKYNEDYKISNVSTNCGSNGSGVISLDFVRQNANGGT
ncbi:type 4 pilus major pilin [Pseudomonas helleri]|uniref:type 4 pilus major pilin n=1 Tax=Pseudomonas helleri TaxID=1608996 RepID=UPI00129690ED|nr:type 4 pilus major pilin [Pseudomonas helleri]MQT35301.1 hypothetical protein [Pseudomonas helleri]